MAFMSLLLILAVGVFGLSHNNPLDSNPHHRAAREVDLTNPPDAVRRTKRCDDTKSDILDQASSLITKIRKCSKDNWMNYRAYRDAPKCCGKMKIVTSEDDEKLMKKCEQHIDGDQVTKTTCWMDCMAREKNVVNGTGYLIGEEFKRQYLKHYVDPALQSLTTDSIDRCVDIANREAKNLGLEKNCSRAPFIASLCVRYFVETKCPAEEQIRTDDCNQVREKIQIIL